MTPTRLLARLGELLYGPRWPRPMSAAIGVNVRTLQRCQVADDGEDECPGATGALAALVVVLGRAYDLLDEASQPRLGATGRHPQGVLNDDDEGELRMAVRFDRLDGLIHVEFGKPVAWLALPPENALALAKALLKHAAVTPR